MSSSKQTQKNSNQNPVLRNTITKTSSKPVSVDTNPPARNNSSQTDISSDRAIHQNRISDISSPKRNSNNNNNSGNGNSSRSADTQTNTNNTNNNQNNGNHNTINNARNTSGASSRSAQINDPVSLVCKYPCSSIIYSIFSGNKEEKTK